MDMRKYSGAGFIKVADVKAGGPLRVVIDSVTEGKYGKPDLEFEDGRKLGVNTTNNKILVGAYGDRSEDWIGKEIELTVGQVEYQGALQDSVLVKPISPPIKRPPPKPHGSDDGDMNDRIPF